MPRTHSLARAALNAAMFEASPDALLLVDADGRIVEANSMAAATLGYAAHELTGLSVDALVPMRVRDTHAAYREGYGNAPRARPMGLQSELVAMRKDGSETQVEIALSPIEHDGRRYVLAAVREVSAYPRVQQALKRARFSEQAARLAQAGMDAPDANSLIGTACELVAEALAARNCVVFLLEPGGETLRVAGGTGLVPGEQAGDRIPNRPDHPAGYVIAQGEPVVVEDGATEARYPVPQAYVEAGLGAAVAVRLADRGRVVGVLSVRAPRGTVFGEEELRFVQAVAGMLAATLVRLQTEEQLHHAQRMESLGQLTGGVAHDFNNLLTVILGNLQVAGERAEALGDPALPPALNAATRAARRGADLTARLLAFARRQVLQPARVDVPRLLHALAGMLRRTLDERLELAVDAPPDLACRADLGQLESALLNMAINARDAMPDGGTLAFGARRVERLPRAVALAWPGLAPGPYVEIRVRDTGQGMSEAVRARAFEPFFTTKDAGRGTGLGLSTVYGFVQQSMGAIALDSAPGQGTTVTLYLPAWNEAVQAPDPGPARQELPAGVRLLLVEDDPEVRAVVRGYLAGRVQDIVECGSAEEALAVLEVDAGFSLLLSDIVLGAGLDGTALADEVELEWPRLPIVLMTGYAADALPRASRWPTLAKPFTREGLVEALARALGTAAPAA